MIGEVLITLGVLVVLFLVWQLWLNDIMVGHQQGDYARQLTKSWSQQHSSAPTPAPSATGPASAAGPQPSTDAPPEITSAVDGRPFATLIIPRLGPDYIRPVSQGIGSNVLNSTKLGIGHYPTTQLPGQPGNMVLASHRKAYGGNFSDINTLHVGDHIYVQTPDGWYQYGFRNLEYVKPNGVGVLDPVPQVQGATPGQRYITLTTCNPLYSTAERIAAYGVFEAFYPASGGPPAEIAGTQAQAEGSK